MVQTGKVTGVGKNSTRHAHFEYSSDEAVGEAIGEVVSTHRKYHRESIEQICSSSRLTLNRSN